MRFERLEVQNFGSYCGEHVLDLTSTVDCPVVVILGRTGYGKTNLFDAINWGLYGQDYERDLVKRRGRKILDYVNEEALRAGAAVRKPVEMSCTVYFEHEGVHYYMSQALCVEAYEDGDGHFGANQTDRTTALYEIASTGDHKRKSYDTAFLDEILPNNVKDYFLFDGDRIYQLSNPGASQEVREAIYRVVDLELIKKANEHLGEVAAEYRRSANRESTGELSSVEEDYARARDNQAELKRNDDNLAGEVRAVKAQIEALEEKLKNLPDTSALQERRSQRATELAATERDMETVTSELRLSCATAGLGFARDASLALVTEIDSKRKRGLIPKTVSEALLTDLLEMGRCICGSEFQKGDRIYRELAARLEAEKDKASGHELIDLLFALKSASDDVCDAGSRLVKLDRQLENLREQKRELAVTIQQIDEQLGKLPKDDVASLTRQLRERRTDHVGLEKKRQHVNDQIADLQAVIRDLEKKREELGKRQANVRKYQLREKLAQEAADELDQIYGAFAEDSRKAVEQLTREEFARFVESASAYEVALNEQYELQVLDSTGNRALQRLSMGQSQCLSLAFITAISRVSEKNPPLVIDMPFGRLDREVHDEVSKRLPEITSQLILFLIPGTEWNDVTERLLRPRCSHIYELDFDKLKRESAIRRTGGENPS